MDAAAGTLIADRYRLVEPLARGAMGQLWVARDERLDRAVALKLIADRHRFDEAAHLRFKREALATARLKSPHVVPVFDHGTDGDAAFIVMELLEGLDLGSYLARSGALALDHVVWLCEQVARGLTAAHDEGVLHRDIKPANLFLTLSAPHPIIKLLDFGIARLEGFQGSTTATGEVVGSPVYMSPEQAQGLPLRPSSDLFSLATILHNCLSGERAFDAPVLAVVFDRVRAVDIAPITTKRPGLPPALDGFFGRAMQVEPTHRYQSAMDLYRAFVEAAGVAPRPLPQRPEDASMGVPSPANLHGHLSPNPVAPAPTVGPMAIPGGSPGAAMRWSLVVGIGVVATGLLGLAGYIVASRPVPAPAANVSAPAEDPASITEDPPAARSRDAASAQLDEADDPPPAEPASNEPSDDPAPEAPAPEASASADTPSAPARPWRPPVRPGKGTKPKIDLDYD